MRKLLEFAGKPEALIWLDWGLLVFLFLYAAFGIREMIHHFRIALQHFREKYAGRRARGVVVTFGLMIVALGPLYITLEAIERLSHHT